MSRAPIRRWWVVRTPAGDLRVVESVGDKPAGAINARPLLLGEAHSLATTRSAAADARLRNQAAESNTGPLFGGPQGAADATAR